MSEEAQTALVVAAYGARCLIEIDGGPRLKAQVRRRGGTPVCGDHVALEDSDRGAVIARVLPRRNEFARADRRGDKQVIAANLDRVVIVVAPQPEPSRDLINRYLVACESLQIPAAICLNKRDQITNPDLWARRERDYRELGYPFVQTSTKQANGLDPLSELLRDATSILVGQSGVGKSSIANRLLPDRELPTGDLSGSGKGKHTTTATTLYHLPEGGQLMDSPGVWEYGFWKMTPGEIAAGFIEFYEYADKCRFANCIHRVEPDCAVAEAAERGEIDPGRLASYRRIVEAQAQLY